MMELMIKIVVSIAPVFAFLGVLIILDSYKIVRLKSILKAIFFGCLVGVAGLVINTLLLSRLFADFSLFSKYIAPVIEEILKALYFIHLIKSKKVGFMIDGAIYGFAIGAAFAFVENSYALHIIQDSNLLLWIIRGFGTAVMHGSTTAIMAILYTTLSERDPSKHFKYLLPGLMVAIVIHSGFNHFIIGPRLTTIVQLIILPVLLGLIFNRSEKVLRDWLELGLDTDVVLLDYIIKGQITATKIGRYLQQMMEKFPGEIVADMLCYLRIHLELAIQAKGLILLKGAGFGLPADPEITEKFKELEFLEKSLGKTGKLAIAPLLHANTRDLWQLYMLDKK